MRSPSISEIKLKSVTLVTEEEQGKNVNLRAGSFRRPVLPSFTGIFPVWVEENRNGISSHSKWYLK